MKISYHVFRDYRQPVASESDEQALAGLTSREREKARRNLYSFVSMHPHPARGKLFLGTTNRCGDILVEFDLKTRKFKSCGFMKSGLRMEGNDKIHKGINLDEQADALYFGTASLLPFEEAMSSAGGQLLRYDLASGVFTRLACPTPGDHYQSTLYDASRRLMYVFTRSNAFLVYDLRRKKLVRHEQMQSCPHNGVIDPEGGVWGLCSFDRHAFFRYDPDRDKFGFPGTCFPNAMAAANIMYSGAGPADSMIDGGDGFLYTGSALGEFYRIDWKSGAIEYLGKPFPDRRLPGLALGADGWIYLCGGSTRVSMLGRYNPLEGRFDYLGPVEHPDGTRLHYAHELAVIDGTVYIGETDNRNRSGYLWICEL